MKGRLRVLHVASGDLWAGAEVQIWTLLRQLSNEPAVGVHVVLLNPGELEERLCSEGLPVTILDESRHSGLWILKELVLLCGKLKPDVIHTHRSKEHILGWLASLFLRGRKLIRTEHGAPEHPMDVRFKNKTVHWLNRYVARRPSTHTVAVSSHLAQTLAEQYGEDKVTVIENGVDVAQIRGDQVCAPFRQRFPDAFHVGFVGRLEPVKRVDVFLEMAAALLSGPGKQEYQFHIFGDGSLRRPLENQAESLGIMDHVTFHGHVSSVTRQLGGLDALVLCSDHEGTPMTLLEACALGLPVIAHQVGGMPAIAKASEYVYLIDRQDPKKFAQSILDVQIRHPAILRHPPPSDWPFRAACNARRLLSLYHQITRH